MKRFYKLLFHRWQNEFIDEGMQYLTVPIMYTLLIVLS